MSTNVTACGNHKKALLEMIACSIDRIGSGNFAKTIADLCLGITEFGSIYICAYFHDHKPCEIYSDLSELETQNTIVPYLDFAYVLDPFYDLFKKNTGDCVVLLNECAPDNFRATEYYRMFYAGTGLLEECAVFISLGPSSSILISLGSRGKRVEDAPRARHSLETLLPVLCSICRRHWPRLDPATLAGTGRLGHQVGKSFEMFGTSRLSPRESEIVRLILKGHSSKSMARVLGNSPETVKVHRKRIYAKMNIASQGELFSIFLEALRKTPPNSTEDPLVFVDTTIEGRRPSV